MRDPLGSFPQRSQLHIPCGFKIYVKSIYDNIYKGKDAENLFIKMVTSYAEEIKKKLKINIPPD